MSKNKGVVFVNKEQLLMNSLTRFFSQNNFEHMETMKRIVDKEDSLISLRILDFFVTTYCKKNEISTTGDKFNMLHLEYKGQLKGVQKSAFDPFRRKDRIEFRYDPQDNSKSIDTTIGQLNFFRWIINYGVLDYVREHFKEINIAMIEHMKEKDKQKEKKRAQRKEQKKREAEAKKQVVPIEKKDSLSISHRRTKKTTEMVVTFH